MINTMLLPFLLLFQTSIYTIHFNGAEGNDLSFGNYQGKKILVVNIATGSNRVSQLEQLQQLYQQYHDSLVIVAFPSNSFNNEQRTNDEIRQFCQNTYHTTFQLAEKGAVKDDGVVPIYNWLAQQSENGVMNGEVIGDFQKFLIDKNGQLIGVFGPSVNPMSTQVQNAILGIE